MRTCICSLPYILPVHRMSYDVGYIRLDCWMYVNVWRRVIMLQCVYDEVIHLKMYLIQKTPLNYRRAMRSVVGTHIQRIMLGCLQL